MTEAQSVLIKIMGNQLFDANIELQKINEEEWDSVLTEAKQQAVFSIAFAYLESVMPESDAYRKYYKENSAKLISDIRNYHSHNRIHEILDQNGVTYVILKGQAAARYYPNPMLRTMGDVDFLINKEDRDLVDRLLQEDGYSKLDHAEEHDFHWAYKKETAHAELHWDVPGIPASHETIIRSYLADIFEKRQLETTVNGTFYVPSDFHHGIVLLLHTINHIPTTGVGMRHLLDWLVFTESIPEEEFVKLFREALRNIGILTFAQILTKIGVMYFGLKEKNWCRDADEKICAEFLEDVLKGGNFGRKEAVRKDQTLLIRKWNTNEVSQDSVQKNMMESVRKKAKQDYPICEKYPFLSPVIWGVVVIQYFIKVARGEKVNMIDIKLISAANRRRSIYAELKLFEK